MRWGSSSSAVLSAAVFTTLAAAQPPAPTARFDDASEASARPPVPPPVPAAPRGGPPAAPKPSAPTPESSTRGTATGPGSGDASGYVYREVVDPFPSKKERPEAQLIDPYVGYAPSIPPVDDLLIVNPYTKMLSKTAPRTARYFEAPAGPVRTGMLEISAPPGFRGWVYLNGMVLAALPVRTTVLAGDHGLTVAPAGGAPFTVWIRVAPGERQHFRFSLTGAGVENGASPPVTH